MVALTGWWKVCRIWFLCNGHTKWHTSVTRAVFGSPLLPLAGDWVTASWATSWFSKSHSLHSSYQNRENTGSPKTLSLQTILHSYSQLHRIKVMTWTTHSGCLSVIKLLSSAACISSVSMPLSIESNHIFTTIYGHTVDPNTTVGNYQGYLIMQVTDKTHSLRSSYQNRADLLYERILAVQKSGLWSRSSSRTAAPAHLRHTYSYAWPTSCSAAYLSNRKCGESDQTEVHICERRFVSAWVSLYIAVAMRCSGEVTWIWVAFMFILHTRFASTAFVCRAATLDHIYRSMDRSTLCQCRCLCIDLTCIILEIKFVCRDHSFSYESCCVYEWE